MGKRKIEIAKIDDRRKMHVTFSKRRKGLFGKAMNTGVLCNTKIAMVIFSPAGNPYTFATQGSSVDSVIDQYLSNKEGEQLYQKKVGFWWDSFDVDGYNSVEELQLLRSRLEGLNGNVCQSLSSLSSQVATTQPVLVNDAHAKQPALVDDSHAELPFLVDDSHAELPFLVDDFFNDFLAEPLLGVDDDCRV